MLRLFGRHRVRATFYHLVAIIFLIATGLWLVGWMSDKWSFYLTAILFVADYLAEMYDPHPEAPGPWFRAHFHRFFNDDEDTVEVPKDDYDIYLEGLARGREHLLRCPIKN